MSLVKYSLLSFPIASFGLGVWQLKRLKWKENLLENLNAKLAAEPIDLLSIGSLSDLEQDEYRHIKVTGRFDQEPSHQIILQPRQLVPNHTSALRGVNTMVAQPGVNVITPFHVDGTDLRILINRGWLPKKATAHILEGMGKNGEIVDVKGIYRKSDNRSSLGFKNDPAKNEWHIRDVDMFSRFLRTAPIYIEADESLSPHEGPIGGQTQLTVRNEHLNYAITWFSLGALVYLMWYSKFGKRGFKIRKYIM